MTKRGMSFGTCRNVLREHNGSMLQRRECVAIKGRAAALRVPDAPYGARCVPDTPLPAAYVKRLPGAPSAVRLSR